MNMEVQAVSAVMRAISRTGRLVPFLNVNDKESIWDGYIAVYKSSKQPHTKDGLMARVNVQIKGQQGKTNESEIRYPVELADLRVFSIDNPTVVFVVRMDEAVNETIYYRTFTKEEAVKIVREKGTQKTVSLPFLRLHTRAEEIEQIFFGLILGRFKSYVPLLQSDLYFEGFYGREKELEQLDAFLGAPGGFRWWGVIGPGGAGKSRLGYEWGKQTSKHGWTVRFLKAVDYKNLDTLTEQNHGPLLLIADYARQHTAELGKWMEALCDTERDDPLRLLLLERDEGVDTAGEPPWEKELYLAGNELHLRLARHERLLQLPALEDTPLRELIAAFAAELRKRDASLPELPEEEAETLLDKLGEIDAQFRRPLYAMILTDAFLRDPAATHWTQEELLDRLVLREEEQINNAVRALHPENSHIDEALVKAALRLRRLATALGASGDRELAELLALDADLGKTFEKKAELYNIPSVEELLLYLGLLRYEGGKTLVPALRPDLLGEYALLHWLTEAGTRSGENAVFYAAVLQDYELRTFFQRLYSDYAPLLNAKPERWERLLPRLEALDDERASLYTHLLNDSFDRCTDRTQRGRLLTETARLADSISAETPAAANIFNNLGLLFKAVGDYDRALNYFQKSLAISLKTLGEEHPSTAVSYNNLGLVYDNMGDYPRALEYHHKALAIDGKLYGAEHTSTATSYNNLGTMYHNMGDFPRALEYYQKALAIREKLFGAEHPDTAASYNNLGSVYHDMGDYHRALEYLHKALAIREKVYGKEHPDTATSYHNLAMLYYETGDSRTALENEAKAMSVFEALLGPEHPYTQDSRKFQAFLSPLAAITEATDGSLPPEIERHIRLSDAPNSEKSEYQLSLSRTQLTSSENRMSAIASISKEYYDRASTLYANGEYSEAENWAEKALKNRESILPEENRAVADSYFQLGLIFTALEDPKAEEYHQRALDIRKKVLGETELFTVESYCAASGALRASGKMDAAAACLNAAKSALEETRSENTLQMSEIHFQRALLLLARDDYEGAEVYFQDALNICEKIGAPEHIDTATIYQGLAELYSGKSKRSRNDEDLDQAEAYYLKALSIRESNLNPEHPQTAVSRVGLAAVYARKGKVEEARQLLEKALTVQKDKLGANHSRTAKTEDMLAGIYFELGLFDDALNIYEDKSARVKQGSDTFKRSKRRYQKRKKSVAELFEQIEKIDSRLSKYQTTKESRSS